MKFGLYEVLRIYLNSSKWRLAMSSSSSLTILYRLNMIIYKEYKGNAYSLVLFFVCFCFIFVKSAYFFSEVMCTHTCTCTSTQQSILCTLCTEITLEVSFLLLWSLPFYRLINYFIIIAKACVICFLSVMMNQRGCFLCTEIHVWNTFPHATLIKKEVTQKIAVILIFKWRLKYNINISVRAICQ